MPLIDNAAAGASPRDSSLFLQQLVSHLRGAGGDVQGLQTTVQSGPVLAGSQQVTDALKAAMAALQSAQGQVGGKVLPLDGTADGAASSADLSALASLLAASEPGKPVVLAVPIASSADSAATSAGLSSELAALLASPKPDKPVVLAAPMQSNNDLAKPEKYQDAPLLPQVLVSNQSPPVMVTPEAPVSVGLSQRPSDTPTLSVATEQPLTQFVATAPVKSNNTAAKPKKDQDTPLLPQVLVSNQLPAVPVKVMPEAPVSVGLSQRPSDTPTLSAAIDQPLTQFVATAPVKSNNTAAKSEKYQDAPLLHQVQVGNQSPPVMVTPEAPVSVGLSQRPSDTPTLSAAIDQPLTQFVSATPIVSNNTVAKPEKYQDTPLLPQVQVGNQSPPVMVTPEAPVSVGSSQRPPDNPTLSAAIEQSLTQLVSATPIMSNNTAAKPEKYQDTPLLPQVQVGNQSPPVMVTPEAPVSVGSSQRPSDTPTLSVAIDQPLTQFVSATSIMSNNTAAKPKKYQDTPLLPQVRVGNQSPPVMVTPEAPVSVGLSQRPSDTPTLSAAIGQPLTQFVSATPIMSNNTAAKPKKDQDTPLLPQVQVGNQSPPVMVTPEAPVSVGLSQRPSDTPTLSVATEQPLTQFVSATPIMSNNVSAKPEQAATLLSQVGNQTPPVPVIVNPSQGPNPTLSAAVEQPLMQAVAADPIKSNNATAKPENQYASLPPLMGDQAPPVPVMLVAAETPVIVGPAQIPADNSTMSGVIAQSVTQGNSAAGAIGLIPARAEQAIVAARGERGGKLIPARAEQAIVAARGERGGKLIPARAEQASAGATSAAISSTTTSAPISGVSVGLTERVSKRAANPEPVGNGFANTLDSLAGQGTNALNVPVRGDSAPPAPTPPPVSTPVGQPGWNQELSNRIVWMTGKSLDSAEIHLNPPHLGPMEVRISMNQDQQASIQFVSGHAAVREALEAALPRLREMLGNQQVTVVDVNVSNPSPQQQSAGRNDGRQAHSQQSAYATPGSGFDGDEAVPVDMPQVMRTSNGVLSLYA